MQIQIQIHYASAIQDLFIKTQVQIPDAQKQNQGLFVQIQIHYASAIQEL